MRIKTQYIIIVQITKAHKTCYTRRRASAKLIEVKAGYNSWTQQYVLVAVVYQLINNCSAKAQFLLTDILDAANSMEV